MSFTYDAESLSTDLARVRLAIGDTTDVRFTPSAGVRPDGSNFSDEELAVYISAAGSWQKAVPQVLRALANQWAAHARRKDYDGHIVEDMTRVAAELRAQAAEWESKLPSVWSGLIGFHGTDANGAAIGHMFGSRQWGANPEDNAG
jgi:hypothetical protein